MFSQDSDIETFNNPSFLQITEDTNNSMQNNAFSDLNENNQNNQNLNRELDETNIPWFQLGNINNSRRVNRNQSRTPLQNYQPIRNEEFNSIRRINAESLNPISNNIFFQNSPSSNTNLNEIRRGQNFPIPSQSRQNLNNERNINQNNNLNRVFNSRRFQIRNEARNILRHERRNLRRNERTNLLVNRTRNEIMNSRNNPTQDIGLIYNFDRYFV